MGDALAVEPVNRDTYLAWEAEQAEKHECITGTVFAMVGACVHATVGGR